MHIKANDIIQKPYFFVNSINTPGSKQIKQLKCNQTIFHTYFLSAATTVTLSTPNISSSISLPHQPVTVEVKL